MKNILVIGSINMDMVITTDRIPVLGESVIGGSFRTVPGGKGANQALAAAKLGGSVKMMCRVGNDIYGRTLIENLNNNGVKTPENCVADTSSGVAMITVCRGDNSIIAAPGANAELTRAFVDFNLDMIRWADIVLLQFEIPMDTVLYAAEKSKEHGAIVLVNPAPMRAIPKELLGYTDIFVPNQHEAGQMLGRSINTIGDGKAAVAEILKTGVRRIVITMGSEGCVYNFGDEICHREIFEVDVVDTTAAGDSFVAGLCTGLCRGYTIDKAITLATAVSSIVVGTPGASSSLPNETQVDDFLRQRNEW